PPSNKSSIPCPISYGPKMFLDIRFDEVIFSNLDDGESPPQDVEVYGYLRASSESMTHYLNLADWIGLVSLCPDEDGFITNQNSSPAGCPVSFRDGTHSLLDQRLCRSKKYTNCTESGWDFNNNTIRLLMEESDSLTITVKMIDSDGGSGNDLVCEGIYQIPGQSILDWHKIKNQPFTLTGSQTGSGNCQIKGVMNAVSP
ncbi:MAG: hypothetical protein MUP11_13670, partial [Anaerolineales bacterium]|nr:hypothetical protein [Anaerolineales bacterium]